MPRQLAGFITRFTSTANLGPLTVDRAGCGNADLTNQGCATIAVALHASQMMVSKRAGMRWRSLSSSVVNRGQSRENEQQAPQLGQSAAASGDLDAMRSLFVVNS